MRDWELYRPLGFVRLGDYVAERCGFSCRTAQELMRTDAALERLPLVAAVFEAAEITAGHVRLLARVAEIGSEPFWVGLARRMRVKDLARAVAAHERRADSHPGGGAKGKEGTPAFCDEERTERLQIVAPAWVAGMWRESVTLVRRLVGSAVPAGACLEVVLAEAAGEIATEVAGSPETGLRDRPSMELRLHASASAPPRRAEGTAARQRTAEPRSDSPLDPRAIDRELRRFVTERQRHDALLADHLRLVAVDRGYRLEGFSSLEEYALERFGLSARTLYCLLALQRALHALPALRRAFLAGRLTARQAILVGVVATLVTERAWIERARAVTLRRLDEEIDYWRHLKESRPDVWGLLDGGPLPEGLALVPGQPPRLHASASADPAPDCSITAEAFLRALGQDEAATPLPGRMCVISLRVEPEVREMWLSTLIHLRASVRADLKEWEALAIVLKEFWRVWDNAETRRQRRENPTLERDGWRCAAPGCRSVGTGRLHEHHIVPRAAGGEDDQANTTAMCGGHHLGLLHEGLMRCSGRAPDDIVWEMGVEAGREPFAVFHGERRIRCADS